MMRLLHAVAAWLTTLAARPHHPPVDELERLYAEPDRYCPTGCGTWLAGTDLFCGTECQTLWLEDA